MFDNRHIRWVDDHAEVIQTVFLFCVAADVGVEDVFYIHV